MVPAEKPSYDHTRLSETRVQRGRYSGWVSSRGQQLRWPEVTPEFHLRDVRPESRHTCFVRLYAAEADC